MFSDIKPFDSLTFVWDFTLNTGKNNVWCLYPNKNAVLKSVEDVFGQEPSPYLECTDTKVLLFYAMSGKALLSVVFVSKRIQ